MKARDIMVTDVPAIAAKASINEAVKLLKTNDGETSFLNAAAGLVVVNERGDLAGILSPIDIISALMETIPKERPETLGEVFYDRLCASLSGRLVEDIMDRQSITVTEDAELIDVAEIFAKVRYQRIPVLSERKVVGIICRSHLLFAMARCMLQ